MQAFVYGFMACYMVVKAKRLGASLLPINSSLPSLFAFPSVPPIQLEDPNNAVYKQPGRQKICFTCKFCINFCLQTLLAKSIRHCLGVPVRYRGGEGVEVK